LQTINEIFHINYQSLYQFVVNMITALRQYCWPTSLKQKYRPVAYVPTTA